MKTKSQIILPIVLVCLLAANLHAQQDPLYAQYFNNPVLINPAFAGSAERLLVSGAYRSQWSGLQGAPASFNLNGHVSLLDNRVGAGVVLAEDRIGEFRTTQYGGVFSYRLKVATSTTFSFGMQMGFVQYATDLKDVQVLNPDNRFVPFSKTAFNTGAGLQLKSDRYQLGLSVPRLLMNRVQQGIEEVQLYSQNYYAFGSYLFFLTERIEFKPSALLRLTKDTPLSADVNMNLTFNRLYTAGLFTRNLNTYGVLAQFIFKNTRLSYVFELPGKGSALHFNTHEVGLAVSLDVLRAHNHIDVGL
jgi:type IX secretion system PorP/SprF family membrane protein